MIEKQEDGRWFLDIQPGGRGHKRYRRFFKTKAEAKRFELKISSEVAKDDSFVLVKKDNRRLVDCVNEWYESSGKFLSSGSDTFNRLVKASESMGNPYVRTFVPVLFLDYRSSRVESGTSPSTLNRELANFKTVFNELGRNGSFSGKNPFQSIRGVRVRQTPMSYLTEKQVKELFSLLARDSLDVYLVAEVCLAAGARWGEAQEIMLSDVSPYRIYFKKCKSYKARSVPIGKGLYSRLLSRLSDGPFSDSYSTFSRRLVESGIDTPKGQRTHILRHTFASHFIMRTGDILALQKALGHSSLNQTMVYAHLAPDYLKTVADNNPASLFLG